MSLNLEMDPTLIGDRMVDTGQAWEVTTMHGTRLILDPGAESRWMRIPAIDDRGRLNLDPNDGRWQRLWTAYPLDERERWGEFDIEVGKALRIHTGMNEWWDTSTVVALRPLDRGELPAQLPANPDDDW